MFVLVFRLHRTAQSVDLLLACCAANAACAIVVVMTTLIFIIVSCLHVFLLGVIIHLFCHAPVVVEVIPHYQHESCCALPEGFAAC